MTFSIEDNLITKFFSVCVEVFWFKIKLYTKLDLGQTDSDGDQPSLMKPKVKILQQKP